MRRLIVTGSNGTGKSHVAARLASTRPDMPLVSYDAIRLTRNWKKKDSAEIATALSAVIVREAWILEGGPSLLPQALPRCEGVIWLDPPEVVRAWRLALRPWKSFGRSRAEIPAGNVDWPLQQYAFALGSLRRGREFHRRIAEHLEAQPPIRVWRCRNREDIDAVVGAISSGSV